MIAVCNARKNDIPSGFGLSWRAKARRARENDLLVGDFCQPSTLDSQQQFAKNSFFNE
jgi:succinate dehydrogenase flavin-adding protein (antitoxin of CptAB toxin-antitoxin module)